MTTFPGVAKTDCEVHADHRPSIKSPAGFNVQIHHVWPLGEGGPNAAKNRVSVCPTGHDRIHLILRTLIKHYGKLPTGWTRKFHPEEVRLAKEGYAAIVKHRDKTGYPLNGDLRDHLTAPPATTVIQVPTVTTGNAAVLAAAPEMAHAYREALDEHEKRISVEQFVATLLNQMQVFWNVVYAFVVVNVVLDVGPTVYQAFADERWPDWSKVGFAVGKTAVAGGLAYFVKDRKVNNEPHIDPPPHPPIPLPPAPEPEDPAAGDG